MGLTFAQLLLVFGTLLVIAAALSGLMRGTLLSISVLSVTLGVGLSLADAVSVEPSNKDVFHVVELALILTLFSDGMLVERELLRRHWGPPARALTIAMPITLALIALGAKLLFPELSWAEALVIGAVLAPTDPVVTSSVVSAPGVPTRVRHTLNIESGLNDGLALPLVLVLLVFAAGGGEPGKEAAQLAGESVAGALIGAALGWSAARLLPRLPRGGLVERYEGVYALGVALVAFGLADSTIGNGLIAAFVAGIAIAAGEEELPEAFSRFNEGVSSVFQTVTFFLFGALIVATGFDGSVAALAALIVGVLLVARPLAVFAAMIGTDLPRAERTFIAWFGPKGVASMLFALIVLDSTAPDRTLLFDVASFVILASIAAHGLTDTVGARWIERRMAAR